MVSGFLTSPWDHARMSSAVARPIRNSSKKLTSSTGGTSLSVSNSGDRPAASSTCWSSPTIGIGRGGEPGNEGGSGGARGRWVPPQLSPVPRGPSGGAAGSLFLSVHEIRSVHQVIDRGRLIARQVDSKVGGGALEIVIIRIPHLDGHTVTGEHLDVQAQRLELLEQHLERLRDSGL